MNKLFSSVRILIEDLPREEMKRARYENGNGNIMKMEASMNYVRLLLEDLVDDTVEDML